MDRKFNDFNKWGRRLDRFDDFRRGKFRGVMEDARRKYHNGSGDFRDSFRRNLPEYRDDSPVQNENVREKEATRDGDDSKNFSEKFHERQVDYHKDVRSKQSDDALRDSRDDMRRGLDAMRGRGLSEERGEGL